MAREKIQTISKYRCTSEVFSYLRIELRGVASNVTFQNCSLLAKSWIKRSLLSHSRVLFLLSFVFSPSNRLLYLSFSFFSRICRTPFWLSWSSMFSFFSSTCIYLLPVCRPLPFPLFLSPSSFIHLFPSRGVDQSKKTVRMAYLVQSRATRPSSCEVLNLLCIYRSPLCLLLRRVNVWPRATHLFPWSREVSLIGHRGEIGRAAPTIAARREGDVGGEKKRFWKWTIESRNEQTVPFCARIIHDKIVDLISPLTVECHFLE